MCPICESINGESVQLQKLLASPISENFRAQVIRSHLRHDFADFEVVNMDQTMCRFDTVPRRTNDIRGNKHIRITHTRANKKGFTVALAARGN